MSSGARATWFLPDISPETARKQWLAGALNPSGALAVDAGAARALQTGKSLLPAGVVSVVGRFDRGDAVEVIDPEGRVIARGLSAYSSDDAAKLVGRNSADFESILGYRGRAAIIHADDMAVSIRSRDA
jgi:glutamate 5-kinase